jgi:hypothetical protein
MSLTLSFGFVIGLIWTSFQWGNNDVHSILVHESTEPYYFTIRTNYTGPNIFFPYAELSFAIANQYSDNISGFHFFLSLSPDNSSWVEIPLTKPLIVPSDIVLGQNSTQYNTTNVGIIPLNGFSNVLYAEEIFPQQRFDNATQTRILNSFIAYFYVAPIWNTPQSIATIILVWVALTSFIIQILDFSFKEKNDKPSTNTSKAERGIQKENRQVCNP